MVNREVMPEESGVIYRSGDRQVLWAFRDLEFPFEGPATVRDVLNNECCETASLKALKHHVYAVGD